MMNYALFALDLIAIAVLAYALYFPRHRRKDLAVALVVVNVGVFTVTTALASNTTLGAGLGLGLFGVLSIIRLRSSELSQVEVAYYFAALAVGLISGLGEGVTLGAAGVLVGAIILVLALADAPLVMRASRHMQMNVDRAISSDPAQLKAYVEETAGVSVREINVIKLDYVNDSTLIDLRC